MSHSRWLWNVFVVWLLTGIWHGANWTFILWGLAYFVLLVVEREAGLKLGHVGTMLAVIFLWVVFRCETVGQGVSFIASMLGLKGNAFCDAAFAVYLSGSWSVFVFALIGMFPVVGWLKRNAVIESLWLCFVFTLSVCEVVSSTYNPFIYFNF